MNTDISLELRRQAVHAAGILTLIPMFLLPRAQAEIIFAFIAGILLLAAMYRGHRTKLHKHMVLEPLIKVEDWFERQILKFERPNEFPLRGALLFYISVLIVFELFPVGVAAASVAVLAIGDSLSTLAGKTFGRHKLPVNRQKSWEGSAAFFIGAVAVLLFFANPAKAISVAFIAAAVEALPYMDDNLSVPIATGLVMVLLG